MVEHLAQHSAHLEHLESFPAECVPRSNFDQMLLDLLDLNPRNGTDGKRDGRRAAMVAALEGRANYCTIRQWRRGARRPPAWALQLLENKIARRVARLSRSIANN